MEGENGSGEVAKDGNGVNLYDMLNKSLPEMVKSMERIENSMKLTKEEQDKKNSEFEKKLMELAGKKEDEAEKKAKEEDKEKQMEKQDKPEKGKYPYEDKKAEKAEPCEEKKGEYPKPEEKKKEEMNKSNSEITALTDSVNTLVKALQSNNNEKLITKSAPGMPDLGSPSAETVEQVSVTEWAAKTAEQYPTPEKYNEAAEIANSVNRLRSRADTLESKYGMDTFKNLGGLA